MVQSATHYLYGDLVCRSVLSATPVYWDYLSTTIWFPLKAILLVALIAYHFWCFKLMKQFRRDANSHSSTWYRWFNEAPAVALIVIVVLAILKPF